MGTVHRIAGRARALTIDIVRRFVRLPIPLGPGVTLLLPAKTTARRVDEATDDLVLRLIGSGLRLRLRGRSVGSGSRGGGGDGHAEQKRDTKHV